MVIIQTDIFHPGKTLEQFAHHHDQMGALVSFTGHVRGRTSEGIAIHTLELEHYPGFTESEIEKIEAQAHKRWPHINSLIIHRYGILHPQEPIVFVATQAPHRQAAFDSASFLMDYLKIKAPFWKKEQRADGHVWIEPRQDDYQAQKSWTDDSRH